MNKFYKNIVVGIATVMCFALSTASVSAQERYFDERYIYSQAHLNPILINPGATGANGDHNLLLNYRNNWASFDSQSPKTVTLSYDGAVADRLGFGAMFMQDSYGALQTSKGQLSFSYTIESEINRIGFGLSTEYIQHKLNSADVNDILIDRNDPIYQERRSGAEFFDASFGVFGLYNKKITYGLSLPSLISSRIDDIDGDNERELGFMLHLGYLIESQSTGIDFEPSMIVKKLNGIPTHVDLNMRLGFLEDKFQSGVSYTLGGDKRLGFLLGFAIDRLNLYYTYNTTMHEFQQYNNGGHELSARFSLGSDVKTSTMTKETGM